MADQDATDTIKTNLITSDHDNYQATDSDNSPINSPINSDYENKYLDRQPSRFSYYRQKSIQHLQPPKDKKSTKFYLYIFGLSLLALILFLPTIPTLAASLKMKIIFYQRYSSEDIADSCYGKDNVFDSTLLRTGRRGGATIIERMEILSIIDTIIMSIFIFALLFSITFMYDILEKKYFIGGYILYVLERFFAYICYTIWGIYVFIANSDLHNNCDSNSNFYKELDGVFDYLVPIYIIAVTIMGMVICSPCVFICYICITG